MGGPLAGRRGGTSRPGRCVLRPSGRRRAAPNRRRAPREGRATSRCSHGRAGSRPVRSPAARSDNVESAARRSPRQRTSSHPTVAAPGADSSGVIAPAGPPPAESLPEISRPPGAGPDGTTARVSRGLRVPAKDLAIDDAVGTPISDSATALTVRGEPLSDVQVVPAGNARRPVGEKAEVRGQANPASERRWRLITPGDRLQCLGRAR